MPRRSPPIYLTLTTGTTFKNYNMTTFIIVAISWCMFIILLGLTEEYVSKDLKETSRFKIWWRKHIIGDYTGPDDLW